MPPVKAAVADPPVHPHTPGSTSVQTSPAFGQAPSHVGAAASPHTGTGIVVDVVVEVTVVTVVIVVTVVLVVVLVAPPQPARQAS